MTGNAIPEGCTGPHSDARDCPVHKAEVNRGNIPTGYTDVELRNMNKVSNEQLTGQTDVLTQLTYEQEIHALMYVGKRFGEDLLRYLIAQHGQESGDPKKLTMKAIEWVNADLLRFDAAIPVALARRNISKGEENTMQPHQQRVVDEKRELDDKLEKLLVFIDAGKGVTFSKLGAEERTRLTTQAKIMRQYSDILADRIAAFPPTS